jgi:NAD(P)-dependent dehydrogenase (short-subunit alcohol dehydrogenase family)
MSQLRPVPTEPIKGAIALVTGAGQGIGQATALSLFAAGAKVIAGYYQRPSASLPTEIDQINLDVTEQNTVDSAARLIDAKYGGLDILVNNAGIVTPIGRFDDLSSKDIAIAFEVNVVGTHRVVKAMLPFLKRSRGVIINAGSGAAFTPFEGWTAYCSSKAALAMLSRVIDVEIGSLGVKTFFLGIPPTDTGMQAKIRSSGLNKISEIPQSALNAVEVPASIITWLCSPKARAIEAILVDVRDELFVQMMNNPKSK